ncbi:hypothetical protein [Capnocytophaga sp.]|uniref:hypothetical protein n=1 Tax=Capnocytophaga sp. TaxID=44737 RepID=UPI0026DC9B98|nr:hypothetical protein [Capnocytophaga sp.]MDO5105508.1 hypothetical protein [Capnocytophaga sp.]
MKHENLLKIYEYMRDNDTSQENVYNTYGQWIGDVIFWYMPFYFNTDEVADDYDYKEEIELTNSIFHKVGLKSLNEEELEEIRKGNGFMIMQLLFRTRKNSKSTEKQNVSFAMMLYDNGKFGYMHCNDVDTESTYKQMLIDSEPFIYEFADKTGKFHFDEMLKFTEDICKELEIETKQNQGNFEKASLSDEEAFDELVCVLNYNNYLTNSDISELKTDWKNINHNRRAFADRLIDEGIWYEEDLEYLDDYQKDYLLYWAFTEKFRVFKDDWKFDVKELCRFISEEIGEPFKITFKEVGNDWELVRQKLELHTEYTLLDLASGNDDCNFIVAQKDEKYVIYALAEQLGLWVE